MMYKDFGLKLTPKFFVNDSAVLKKYRELHESFDKTIRNFGENLIIYERNSFKPPLHNNLRVIRAPKKTYRGAEVKQVKIKNFIPSGLNHTLLWI